MTETHPRPTLARLAELTGGRLVHPAGASVTGPEAERSVSTAAIDARDVPESGMFMAVPGTRNHGAHFIGQSAGHSVLTDEEGLSILTQEGYAGVTLVVGDCRRWLGPVAAEIHGHPSREMTVIGVTGTSGKTTTTYMMEQALLGHHPVGLIGTTGTRINGQAVPTSLTTPEAPTLQTLFARMRDEGVTHVVMEVSSHALVLGRVRGVDFDVVAFTNLSQDHLDFHPTMEDYFDAKALLFTEAQDPTGELPTPVICVDDTWGRRLARELVERAVKSSGDQHPSRVLTVSSTEASTSDAPDGAPNWQVTDVTIRPGGTQHITIGYSTTEDGRSRSGTVSFDLSIPGEFNVANAVLALATLVAAGEDPDISARLAEVQVPGRMQRISGRHPHDFLALVDYAHKPGAVAAVLDTLNGQLDRAAATSARGRLGIVLGAGGNRDHEKRPLMGEVAAHGADLVIITDDNPRDEDPATIRAEVVAGAESAVGQPARYGAKPGGSGTHWPEIREVGDRTRAIQAAVDWARPGDIIVVAGKGHETGQVIGDTVIDFDDREVLMAALDGRREDPTS